MRERKSPSLPYARRRAWGREGEKEKMKTQDTGREKERTWEREKSAKERKREREREKSGREVMGERKIENEKGGERLPFILSLFENKCH